jgi:hypothetical protein
VVIQLLKDVDVSLNVDENSRLIDFDFDFLPNLQIDSMVEALCFVYLKLH